MVGVKQKKLEDASKTRGRTSWKKPAGSGQVGKGVNTLREAAGKAVGQNSKQITNTLLKKTLDGDAMCTGLLLSLAELEPGQERERGRLGWSAALALAAEPQWVDEVTEAGAETGNGSREPEG